MAFKSKNDFISEIQKGFLEKKIEWVTAWEKDVEDKSYQRFFS